MSRDAVRRYVADLELLLAGIFLFVLGIPALIWQYESAKLGERMDAIGSSRGIEAVELAAWKVSLTKFLGVALSGGGVVAAVLSVV